MSHTETMNSNQEDRQESKQAVPEPHPQHNKEWEAYVERLEKLNEPEAKIQEAINFMQASISREGTPHFKNFWEARTLCLPLFKENIPAALRSHLWEQYDNLSKEARRLKEILDEQSAFAAEQIEIAIKAIETELDTLDQRVSQTPQISLPQGIKSIQRNQDRYQSIQRTLAFLNVAASRINALRKELIKTEMRIRQKNKFFQRLSAAGDRVFPKRKELIREVSDLFSSDVDEFIHSYFSKEDLDQAVFRLREDIKGLQNFAKDLTLNTQSFTHTRMKLSECWDKLKEIDKERKKERSAQKAAYKENVEAALEKMRAFTSAFSEGSMTIDQGYRELDVISQFMRNTELGRDEVKFLRNELAQVRKLVDDKVKVAEQERAAVEEQKLQQRREKFINLKNDLEKLVQEHAPYDTEEFIIKRDALQQQVQSLPLSKLERQELDKHLKTLRDLINDKKQEALLALSPDDQQAFQKLCSNLEQYKSERQDIKRLLDNLRKESGSSGLDFTQGLQINATIAVERERLEKLNHQIEEIEEKIADFEKMGE